MTGADDRLPRVPAWKLERYALGELPADELHRLRQRLESDADLRRQVEALRAGDAEVRGQYPTDWMARQIRARAQRAEPARGELSWNRWLGFLAPAAAVALLAVVALPSSDEPGDRAAPAPLALTRTQTPPRTQADGVRIKGDGPTLLLHRRTAAGSERLTEGSPARQGDLLRLQYAANGASHGAILSIDGRGVVTWHLPRHGDRPGAVAAPLAAGPVALDSAYELDAAPRWERFYLVAAAEPFDLDGVAAAAARAAAGPAPPERLDLPERLAQTGLTVTKIDGANGEEAR